MGGFTPTSGAAPAAPTESAKSVGPARQVVFSPSSVPLAFSPYILPDDQISLGVIPALANAGITVIFDIRVLRADGTLSVQEESITTGAVAHFNTQVLRFLAEGFLVSVTARITGGNQMRGAAFASARLFHSSVGAQISYLLFEGYVGTQTTLAWPAAYVDPPTSGGGFLTTHTIANPGAGNEFSFTVPATTRLRLMGLSATFTTSAVVANRVARLQIDDNVNIAMMFSAIAVQAASQAITYRFMPGVTSAAPAGAEQMVAISTPTMLNAGWHIASTVLTKDAGDTWTSITFGTEEWFDA